MVVNIISNTKEGEEPPMAHAIPSYGATAPVAAVTIDGETNDEDAPLIVASQQEAEATGPVFRDVGFAILFWLHLVVMIYLGIAVAPAGYENWPEFNLTSIEEEIRREDNDHSMRDEDYKQLEEAVEEMGSYLQVYPLRIFLYLVLPCLLISFVVAMITTATVIKPYPKPIVYATLLGSVLATAMVMLSAAIASQAALMWLVTLASLAAVGYYVKLAWRIVPFAAVNLKVALEAVGSNWGVYIMAFVFSELGFLWNIFWIYVLIGVSVVNENECLKEHPDVDWTDDTCSPNPLIFLALLLSLYWTSTVLMNTMQTTVAGIVATWCFVAEEAKQCCSPAVTMSLFRSLTYSFGSICFGSLLQAIVSVIRYLVENARNRRNDGGEQDMCGTLVFCILECLVRCLDEVLDYFNQWAYCYVGIYGTSYLQSGKSVIELFRARGWTSIISDKLVGYTLGFVTFAVGIVTGFIGLVLERILANKNENGERESFIFGPVDGSRYWAFGVSFLVGLWVCSVMMNVVQGAVNALIVCWADSPAKLEYQHPVLTLEMAEAWDMVFPEANVLPASRMIV